MDALWETWSKRLQETVRMQRRPSFCGTATNLRDTHACKGTAVQLGRDLRWACFNSRLGGASGTVQ